MQRKPSRAPASSPCIGCGADSRCEICEHCGVARAPGGFRVVQVIAESDRGRTYRAEAAEGRTVALKELVLSRAASVKTIAAFEREGEMLQQLWHPQIPRFVASFRAGQGAGTRLYLAQEFQEGRSLTEFVARRRLSEPVVEEIGTQILRVLAYLHGLSPPVVHLDIKPDNLIVRRDKKVALVDFDAALELPLGKLVDAEAVGSVGYAPPEQLAGRVTASCDLYALGVTLLHLLSRRPPHEMVGANLGIELERHVRCSARMERFLKALLARDPAERVQTAAEALELLGRTHDGKVPRRRTPAPDCPLCKAATASGRCLDCGSPVEVGGFLIQRLLSRRLGGRTYEAEDRQGRRVALKEFLYDAAPSRRERNAFAEEAEVLSSLWHPRIPRFVCRFEEGRGAQTRFYLAQAFFEGRTLEWWAKRRAFSEREVLTVGRCILKILTYLHGRTPCLVHGSIEPSNLLISKAGELALVGCGRARSSRGRPEQVLVPLDSLGYLAPEQLRGTMDPRSDLYGLGATLVFLLTRRPPHYLEAAADLGGLENLSSQSKCALLGLVAQKPEERFASAAVALEALAPKPATSAAPGPMPWE